MYTNFGSLSINRMQYYTTSLPSFRKDNTFLHAFVDLLINTQPKSSNKALLFIGRCDKSTEISSFAGRAVTRSSLEREVRGLNLGPVKSDTLLPTARRRYDIFSKGCVAQAAMTWRWAVPTLCTFRLNTTSIKQKLKKEQRV